MRAGAARSGHFSRIGEYFRILVLLVACGVVRARAAEPEEVRAFLLKGDYDSALALARTLVEERPRDPASHQLLIEGLLTLGRYPEADVATSNALARARTSVGLRWVAREVYRSNGRPEEGEALVAEIPTIVSRSPWAFRDPQDLIAVGRALLVAGMDPKEILERVYNTARKANPNLREVYLASGDLALEKKDFALAARHFDEGLKRFPQDPDLHHGRALAFADSDRKEMAASVEAALKANPRHLPSLLLMADHRIDAEDYDGALKLLEDVRSVNPHHPAAWSYAAVIAHLRNDPTSEAAARGEALKFWPTNPEVPHLIGRKLSEKYRFAEGAALQREALAFSPSHLPAKAQLASDLLRLGEDAAGWELIQEVHSRDAYDVTAYNLVTLKDTMSTFSTLTNASFVVRMQSREAAIYGERVMNLLTRAEEVLVPKYGASLELPITVEIFHEPRDFGVRTFGMPDNPGYLGVCFGRVITANSPASSRAKSVNWEAVLWHEFCHVVTLQLTRNKMPRWLSEGISVYEERLANPAWGEQLNPKYRQMILGGELTPIGRLSAAFLMPKTGLHLQFAYYQSSLVVQLLVERYGIESLRKILTDLGSGVFINDAIERHAAPLEQLEKDFAAYARGIAEALGPELTWDEPAPARGRRPQIGDAAPEAPAEPADPEKAGRNFWKMMEQARALVAAKRWEDAQPLLEELLRQYPRQTGADSAHALLARVLRERGDVAGEQAVLERWAQVDAAARDAYARLMELHAAEDEWDKVVPNADRYLAVDPLVPLPYRQLAAARERLGETNAAVENLQTLLILDPPNPAEVHFHLARLLQATDPAPARRHLLQSLEDAPRNRAALQLLLDTAPTHAPPRPATGQFP